MSEMSVEARDWLHAADDDVLACRGAGRHGFDKLRRNRPMTNTHTMPVLGSRNGVVMIVQTCPDCRMVERTMVTAPRGSIDLPAKWRYRVDPRYRSPKGSGVTGRMALAETVRRMDEDGTIAKMSAAASARQPTGAGDGGDDMGSPRAASQAQGGTPVSGVVPGVTFKTP